MKGITTIAVLVIMVMMSGTTVAEGDQIYGMMNMCTDCTDTGYDTASLPCEQFGVSSTDVDVLETGGAPATLKEYEWDYGMRNIIPDNLSCVMYDFEEGSNCWLPFINMYPEVATFLTVLGTQPYGCDEPSYVTIGGNTCGAARCKMYIYPSKNLYYNGTPKNWIYIVNGNDAFAPITGPDYMGGYWPAMNARIIFRPNTHYISFLASTGGDLRVELYDECGSTIYSTTIRHNIDRVGNEPSNFTRLSVYKPDRQIVGMKLKGSFNAWCIDDMVVGGNPGWMTDPPKPAEMSDTRKDYSHAADRMKELVGAQFLEFGAGYNLVFEEFYTPEQIINDELPYWNPETKEIKEGKGIYDENAIVYAFNEIEDVVNWMDINRMAKHDFSEHVECEDVQPGDVFFIDYDADGCYDEIGIVIDPQYDQETGMYEDIIRIIPEQGVHYSSRAYIEAMYGDGTTAFVDYMSLPDNPKGGHSPYPKIPTKYKI